jgi:hypothetical protein
MQIDHHTRGAQPQTTLGVIAVLAIGIVKTVDACCRDSGFGQNTGLSFKQGSKAKNKG